MVHFDREIYFNAVRGPLFGGSMTQGQVRGQEAILLAWEIAPPSDDLRHLAYCLGTTKHETANEMQPIEEYHGANQPYGQEDPETHQRYYGRGFVQLTHRENYRRADVELGLEGDSSCEWYAENALVTDIAARILFWGSMEGWFRSPNNLPHFFNSAANDAYGAREIVNGDKHVIPSWSNGVSIGKMIAGYHEHFLNALIAASAAKPMPPIAGTEIRNIVIKLQIEITAGAEMRVLALDVVEA